MSDTWTSIIMETIGFICIIALSFFFIWHAQYIELFLCWISFELMEIRKILGKFYGKK